MLFCNFDRSILATDMAQHSNILAEFKDILAKGFDFTNNAHKRMVRYT